MRRLKTLTHPFWIGTVFKNKTHPGYFTGGPLTDTVRCEITSYSPRPFLYTATPPGDTHSLNEFR